jgi:hypothetical protein
MKHRIIIAVVVLLGILATGCSNANDHTMPLATTGTIGINSASFQSVNDLNLSLSTDSTTYRRGQAVSIVIDETNTLSTTNIVSASDKWPYNHLHLGPCDYISPFGMAVFQGNYNASNFSTATALTLFDPHIARTCMTNVPVTSFSFQPSSDIANVIEDSGPYPNPYPNGNITKMNFELILNGYWPDDNYNSHSHLTYFNPGIYTIVGGDEWGTLVIVHFTVSK